MAYTVLVSAGTPETGVWCDTCLLPSALRIPLYQISEHGSSLLRTVSYCPDCGGKGTDGARD